MDGVLGHYDAPPDAVVVVVDAGVIERALYLVLQIAETGIPVVVALNMMDEAAAAGAEFDTGAAGPLARRHRRADRRLEGRRPRRPPPTRSAPR